MIEEREQQQHVEGMEDMLAAVHKALDEIASLASTQQTLLGSLRGIFSGRGASLKKVRTGITRASVGDRMLGEEIGKLKAAVDQVVKEKRKKR